MRQGPWKKGFDELKSVQKQVAKRTSEKTPSGTPSETAVPVANEVEKPADFEKMRVDSAVHRYLANTVYMDWDKALSEAVKGLTPNETILFGHSLENVRAQEKSAVETESRLNAEREGEQRASKALRERGSTKTKPAWALDLFERLVRGEAGRSSMRQPDAEAWALRGLEPDEVDEFHRLRAEAYRAAQTKPLGPQYAREAQNVPAPQATAGNVEIRAIRPGRRWEFSTPGPREKGKERIPREGKRAFLGIEPVSRNEEENESDAREDAQKKFRELERAQKIADMEEQYGPPPMHHLGDPVWWDDKENAAIIINGDRKFRVVRGGKTRIRTEDGRTEVIFADKKERPFSSVDPLTPEERASRGLEQEPAQRSEGAFKRFLRLAVDEEMPTGIVISQLSEGMDDAQREALLQDLARRTGFDRATLLNTDRNIHMGRTPRGVAESLYEAQTPDEITGGREGEYKNFMDARFRMKEDGKAEVIFRDGRRIDVEGGRSVRFRNAKGETRKMVFDSDGSRFMDRQSYDRMLQREEKSTKEDAEQKPITSNVVEFPKPALEPFRRMKAPDPKEFKAIEDELAADAAANFVQDSRLLSDVLAVQGGSKLVGFLKEQLPKIAEVDREGFERIRLRTGVLASFEKGEYKDLKAQIVSLEGRFGVRADVFERAIREKNSIARRVLFRAEIQTSLGMFGRLANTVSLGLYSRLRARGFELASRAFYERAERRLGDYRRGVGAELSLVITRNKNIRGFFEDLLRIKKGDVKVKTEESGQSIPLAA